jgi:hypothetical protein
MAPPAINDPLIWGTLGASVFLLLLTTVLYGPLEALEQRLGVPQIMKWPGWLRSAGIIGGLLGLVFSIVVIIFF